MSNINADLGSNNEQSTEGENITDSVTDEDTVVEQGIQGKQGERSDQSKQSKQSKQNEQNEQNEQNDQTPYVCDRPSDLPQPDDSPRVGIAASTSDEIKTQTVYVYTANEWTDTGQPADELVSELLDESDTEAIHGTSTGFEISNIVAPAEATVEETVTVAVELKNSGVNEHTGPVRLMVDGTLIDSAEPTVDGGETDWVDLEWTARSTDGSDDLIIETDSDTELVAVDVKEPHPAFSVEGLCMHPDAPVEGETISFEPTIQNIGQRATADVELRVLGSNAGIVDRQSVTIDGESTESVTLNWTPDVGSVNAAGRDTDDSTGVSNEMLYQLRVSHGSTRHETHSDQFCLTAYTDTLSVDEPTVEPATPSPNTPVTVETAIENTGTVDQTVDVTLSVDDSEIATERDVDITTAEPTTVSHDWVPDNEGQQTLTVAANGYQSSTTVEVCDKPARFEASHISITPDPVEPNESVTVAAEITNVGGESDSRTIELKRSGEIHDTQASVSLDPRETTSVLLTGTAPDSTGEKWFYINTQHKLQQATVTVEDSPHFEILALTTTPNEIREGDIVAVDVEIQNTGDIEHTPRVQLKANGTPVDVVEPTIRGRRSTEVIFRWNSATYSGPVELTVSARGVTESKTVVVGEPLEPPVFELTDLSTPTEATQGEQVSVETTIANSGEADGIPSVTLAVDGNHVDSTTHPVSGGDTETVCFDWDSTGYDGETTLTVSADDSSTSTTIAITEPVAPATFEVTDLSLPAEVTSNELVDTVVTVENTGDVGGTSSVGLTVDGTQVDSTELPVDTTDTETVECSWDSSAYSGETTLSVSVDESTASTTVDVTQPSGLAAFEITSLTGPAAVDAGETVAITAGIQNTGDIEGSSSVVLVVDGTQVDAAEPTIGATETENVGFRVDSSAYNGETTLTVSVDDSSASTTVDVKEPLEMAAFEVTALTAPPEVPQGETVPIEAAITNTGDVEATTCVELIADGTPVDSTEVSIGGNETQHVRFDWDSSDQLWSVELTVSASGASESTSINVREPPKSPTFDIQNVTAPPSALETGESVTISTNIQNAGDVSDTQEITLQHDGHTVDSTGEVTIEPWETAYVELTWSGSDTAGSEILSVVTDNDSQRTTVDIGVVESPEFSLGSRIKTTTLATEGDTVSFDQNIKNAGSTGTAVVEMTVKTFGTDEQVVDVKTVDMEQVDSTYVTLEWDSEVGDGRPALDDPKSANYEDPVYRINLYDEHREESALQDSQEDTLLLRRARTEV